MLFMINTDLLRDIKTEQIKHICNIATTTMPASSARLFRLDVNKFLHWFRSEYHGLVQISVTDLVRSYSDAMLFNTETPIKGRKASSIRKFLGWLCEEIEVKESKAKVIPHSKFNIYAYIFRLTDGRFIPILFIFLILSGFVGYLLPMTSRYFTFGGKNIVPRFSHFRIYIPVVSNKLPPSLNSTEFILNVFGGKEANFPLFSLKCGAIADRKSSQTQIAIDSSRDCKLLKVYSNYLMPVESDFWVDIAVGATKINSSPILVSAHNTPEIEDGHMQSQISANLFVGKQSDSLINSTHAESTPISSAEALLVPRPNSVLSIPLDVSQVFEVSHGDIVTLTDKTVTKALLNNSVIGVVNNDNLIVNGIAEVNISQVSGEISPGDYISTSLEAGKAVKASLGYENIIGISLESWSKNIDKVKIFVNTRR